MVDRYVDIWLINISEFLWYILWGWWGLDAFSMVIELYMAIKITNLTSNILFTYFFSSLIIYLTIY